MVMWKQVFKQRLSALLLLPVSQQYKDQLSNLAHMVLESRFDSPYENAQIIDLFYKNSKKMVKPSLLRGSEDFNRLFSVKSTIIDMVISSYKFHGMTWDDLEKAETMKKMRDLQ